MAHNEQLFSESRSRSSRRNFKSLEPEPAIKRDQLYKVAKSWARVFPFPLTSCGNNLTLISETRPESVGGGGTVPQGAKHKLVFLSRHKSFLNNESAAVRRYYNSLSYVFNAFCIVLSVEHTLFFYYRLVLLKISNPTNFALRKS